MHTARAFFYVCSGAVPCRLTILGPRSAGGAQALGVESIAPRADLPPPLGGRYNDLLSGDNTRPPVPGSASIVAVDGNVSGNQVLLADGDAYLFKPSAGS